MAIIQQKDLSKIKTWHPDKMIVYASGSFDLVHAGHILFFRDCADMGGVLVVNVGSDYDIKELKGPSRPILNQHIRLYTINQLKPVDYCFIGKPMTNPENPLLGMEEIFRDLRPDIYVINPDAFDIPFRKRVSADFGVKLVILARTCPPEFEAISTSNIIEKIQRLPH